MLPTLIERGDQNVWNEYTPLIEMVLRSVTSASRPFSPNLLIYGRELRIPLHLMYSIEDDMELSAPLKSDYVRNLTAKLKLVHEVNRENFEV